MARRRKSKDAKIFEAITGLIGAIGFLWLLSPGFRYAMQVILLVLVIAALVAFVVWLAFKVFTPEASMSAHKTHDYESHQTDDHSRYKPPTIAEEWHNAQPVPELTISEKLHKIDWFQFEKLIELIYKRRGFLVERMGGANPDGGVDLVVEFQSEKFVVQCKHWKKWSVGVRHIREFLGTLTDTKIQKGIYITLMGYSDDAKKLADKHGIQILNESDLIQMLESSGLMYSPEISTLFSDERKFCPKCEKEMVLRTARKKGHRFWGCSSFPQCHFIMDFEPETTT